jgi:hypothetical protein
VESAHLCNLSQIIKLQPRPEQELTATIFICSLLAGTLLVVIGLGVFVLGRIL